MVFSSLFFYFIYLPLFLVLYYVVPKAAKNYVLLAFSLVFYAWGEPVYVFLMLGMTLSDYILGRLMHRYDSSKSKRKLFLVLSIVIDLSCLAFFKYAGFLVGTISSISGADIPFMEIALPIGISFFTFQTMSYTIDLYRREVTVEKNYAEYLMYVSMFPQLIAGPIVRYKTVKQELHEREIKMPDVIDGFIRFIYGLLKKVLLANRLGSLFDDALSSQNPSLVFAWLGAIAFTLQLYLDFSAYSDMAIGLGKMLGFKFDENFNYPLSAKSVTDFWRRWHISLSSWFRDYVYIPLGGNRCRIPRQIFNLAVVWFLTGLWHGASWNYVIWGVYYGILLCLEKFVYGKYLERVPKFFRHIYLCLIVVVGFTVFAIEDFSKLIPYLGSMFSTKGGFAGRDILFYLQNYGFVFIVSIAVSMPIFPALKKKISGFGCVAKKIFGIIYAVIFALLFVVAVSYMVSDTYNPFLYFRF
ncbi:MAG: MBOAT family protein [Treponema sp.]|nr:MBOAT family protein [Treponema sp.]